VKSACGEGKRRVSKELLGALRRKIAEEGRKGKNGTAEGVSRLGLQRQRNNQGGGTREEPREKH